MTRHDLLFTYDFPPMGGGIARWMAAIAAAAAPGTLRVSTGTMPGSETSDTRIGTVIDRIPVPAPRLRTLPGLVRWSHRAAQLGGNPAARFAWAGTFRPAAWPAWWAAQRTALPYGVIWHGGDLLILRDKAARHPRKQRQWQRLLRGAAVHVANSRWTASQLAALLAAWGGLDQEVPTAVVHPGTTPEQWVTTLEAVEQFRRRRHLPAGRYLVTLARLVPHKGIDTGIDLLAALRHSAPDLRYLVIGRGPARDILAAQAAARGVADRVHLLSDVEDDELAAAMGLGCIYLGLSREDPFDVEGFGIALLEAAAAGLPVVAHRSGGIVDAVADGETGILVPPGDAVAACAAVQALLDDPSRRVTLGAAGRARVVRDFTWGTQVARLLALAQEHGRVG